jgi:hypothetical protein
VLDGLRRRGTLGIAGLRPAHTKEGEPIFVGSFSIGVACSSRRHLGIPQGNGRIAGIDCF